MKLQNYPVKPLVIAILLLTLVVAGIGTGHVTANGNDSAVNETNETLQQNTSITSQINQTITSGSPPETDNNTSILGAPSDTNTSSSTPDVAPSVSVRASAEDTSYTSQTFTVSDIVTFSYANDNQIQTPSGTYQLDRGNTQVDNVNRGVYDIAGEGPFSTLWGDPVSSTVVGYFAESGDGSPLDTTIHTYIPSSFDNRERFVVFGYENNTEVTIKLSNTDEEIYSGMLDDGDYKSFKGSDVPHSSFVTIESNNSVSAQTYFDMGFYVPAKNGRWSGEEFYTYVNNPGDWTNDVVVSAFSDNTNVTIKNLETNEIIHSGTINGISHHNEPFKQGTYIKIETNQTATVGVRPYDSWPDDSRYNQGANVPSRSGSKIGTDFIVPTLNNDYTYVSAYENNTQVTVINTETGQTAGSYSLSQGETVDVDPSAGLWRILSDRKISVQAGYGSATASFAPVEFGETETAILEGTITDPNGNAIENADVNIYDATNRYQVGQSISPITTTPTDSDGRYQTSNIDSGKYFIVVDSEQYDPVVSQTINVPRTTEPATLDLELTGVLNPITEEIKGIDDASKAAIDENTESAAEVYIDGYETFEDPSFGERLAPTDLQDGIGLAITAIDTSLSVANPQGTVAEVAAKESGKYIVEETAWSLADHGVDESVAQQFSTLDENRQKELRSSAELMSNEDWLKNYEYTEGKSTAIANGYTESKAYDEALTELAESGTNYSEFEEATTADTLDDDFSVEATADVLEQQQEWLRGNGPADGMVVTPKGNVYTIKQTQAHKADYETAKSQAEAAEIGGTVTDGVQAAGNAAVIYGEPNTKAIGATVQAVGWVGSQAFNTYQLRAENRMGKQWANTQLYWANDVRKIPEVKQESVEWVKDETENPEVQDAEVNVSAEIESDTVVGDAPIVLANKPDYPWYITRPMPQWKASKNASVSIENTGNLDTQDTRIIVTDGYTGDNNNRVSESATVYPRSGNEPLELTNEHKTEVPFTGDFSPLNPFEAHYVTVDAWTEGKLDDSASEMYFIAPSADIPFLNAFSAQERKEIESKSLVRGAKYAYTTADSESDISITQKTFNDQLGNVSTTLKSEVKTGKTEVNTTYKLDDRSQETTFLMIAQSGSGVNLHAYDEANRHVGFSPATNEDEVQIPNTDYTGSEGRYQRITINDPSNETIELAARASEFRTNTTQSVEIYAIEEPDRPPILGTTPADTQMVASPGENQNITFKIAEVAGEQAVNGIDVTAGQFETRNGIQLPSNASVTPVQTPEMLDAGEESELVVNVDIPESVELPDTEQTRFTGEITIDTANADQLNLTVSVLVLDTESSSVELSGAEENVEGVTTEDTPADNIDVDTTDVPTPVGTISDTYTADIVGDGNLTIRYTNRSRSTIEVAYAIRDDGSWVELDTTQDSNGITAGIRSTDTTNLNPENITSIVITREYANDEEIVTTDRLRLAIEDWRSQDVDTELLRTIIDEWRAGEPVK